MTRKHSNPDVRVWYAGLLLCCAWALLGSGCTRQFWRLQADNQVDCLIDRATDKLHSDYEYFSIAVPPSSRLFDPTPPDYPPMPPDDPLSHQLMHCVDCKEGFPCWHRNGDTPVVDFGIWQKYLPVNEDGELVLDRNAAVALALLSSREYQQELETLYLSALDVTFERFRFDAQFFGGNSTFFTADGPLRGPGGASSLLTTANDLRMRRLFASGGELVAGVANTFMWQFAGPDTDSVTTLLDFSFVQPLLRFGSRARVMETLTLSERVLLANIRQMERFRRGFYLNVAVGRNAGPGPTRRGGFFGGSGLQGFTGVGGGGFGRVGAGTGGFATGAGAQAAGGYVGLLQDQQQIRNLEANVAGLRDSLEQLQASFDAGRIDLFQVGQARQALYEAQSQLLTAKAAYQTSLDSFKLTLGLPPELDLVVEDPMLEQFNLIDPNLTRVQEDVATLLDNLRDLPADPTLALLEPYLDDARDARRRAAAQMAIVERDFETLHQNRQQRRRNLQALTERPEFERGELDRQAFDVELLEGRIRDSAAALGELQQNFDRTNARLEQTADTISRGIVPPAEARQQLLDVVLALAEDLNDALLIQARARIDTITIVPVELDSVTAMEIAQQNRRDLMNARATLVDTWRLIEFNANDLESDLNVVFDGDVRNFDNNPVRFRGTTGRLRVGLEFDAPLTRLDERNRYRQSLIEFQQARRQFMAIEDQISASLRNTLRTIELNRANLEIRRAAVVIAISQVEQARLRLGQPPRPGETTTLGATTARDLVDALRQLNAAQNDFLSVWVNYEVQRMNLDFDLGTMQLDEYGMWIDPGPIVYPAADGRQKRHDHDEIFEEIDFREVWLDSILPLPEDENLFNEPAPDILPAAFRSVDGPAWDAQSRVRARPAAGLSQPQRADALGENRRTVDLRPLANPAEPPGEKEPQPAPSRSSGWQPRRVEPEILDRRG